MKKTLTKYPSLNRRPAKLTPQVEQAILARAEGLSADEVKAHIERDTSEDADDEDDSVKAWLRQYPSVDPMHLWWVLEKNGGADAMLKQLGFEEPDPVDDALNIAIDRLVSRYVYATFRDEYFDRKARVWISTRGMDNAETRFMPLSDKGEPVSAHSVLRSSTRADVVINERFIPGNTDEIATYDGVQWLNTWIKSDIEPAPGDASLFLNHILYLCNDDKEQAGHLLDWMSYCYQNPGKKINHAPLVISPVQGVGKDTIADALSRLLGLSNCQIVQDDALSEGRFDFMRSAQLVVVPEVMCGDRRDIANKLKPLITQKTVRINEKNVKPYNVDNTVNFMMFSNYENAAYIEDNDRRYFVVICRQKPKSADYYTEMYRIIEADADPALCAFAHVLATRDLSCFNAGAPAPHTADKDVVRAATRSGVDAWLQDAWESNAHPFDKDVVNLREALAEIGEIKGAPRISLQQISAFLKRIGGGDLGRYRIGDKGNQVRVWAVREYDVLKDQSLAVIDACYNRGDSAKAAILRVENATAA